MKRTLLSYSLAAVLLVSASVVSAADADSDAVVQTQGRITYVSGGVGTESIDRLNSLAGDFNLKLVFALISGDYVSGVQVVVADTKGMPMLDATSEGPWFLTRLPAGRYQVAATLSGKTVNRQVTVGDTKLRTVDFRWIAE